MGWVTINNELVHTSQLSNMSNTDTWQLCPKCNGSGGYFAPLSTGPCVCDVCFGQKIISKSTGLPPQRMYAPCVTTTIDMNNLPEGSVIQSNL